MLLLSLVGEQPIPSLLPLWQVRRFSAVQFAATKTTWRVAEQLVAAARCDPALSHLRLLPILELEAYDIGRSRGALSAALNQYLKEGQEVTLNLTGGTKLMFLAGVQAAFGSGVELLYVSTESGELIWMGSDGAEQRRQPIEVHIRAEQYLRPHGLEVTQRSGDPSRVGSLLEELVYRQALQSGFFDDVQRNVHISKQTENGNRVENELDLVVTRSGRLAVVSCKTGSQIEKTANLNKALYELASLSRREAAGIYCVKMLVTDQKSPKPAVRNRALEMGIHLVYEQEIKNVAQWLKQALK